MTVHLTRLIVGSLLAIGVHNPDPRWCNRDHDRCTASGDVTYRILGGPVHCTIHLSYTDRMRLRSAIVGAGDCVPTTKEALVDMTVKRRGVRDAK